MGQLMRPQYELVRRGGKRRKYTSGVGSTAWTGYRHAVTTVLHSHGRDDKEEVSCPDASR